MNKKTLMLITILLILPIAAIAAPNINGDMTWNEWDEPASRIWDPTQKTPSGNDVADYDLEMMGLLITDTQLIFGVSGEYNLKNGIRNTDGYYNRRGRWVGTYRRENPNVVDPGDFAFSFNDGTSYDLAVDYLIDTDNNVELRFRWGNLQWQDPVITRHLENAPWRAASWDHQQVFSAKGKYGVDSWGNHAIEAAVGLDDLDSAILSLFDNNAGTNGADRALIRLTMECGNDMIQTSHEYDISAVPEPATILLFGIGLLGLSAVGRKKTHKI